MGRRSAKRRAGRTALVIILVILVAIAGIIGVLYLQDYFLRLEYPLKYEDIIVKYANEYGLDPYFVCAMIDTESKFQLDAVSRVNAQGLMQLMPDTAEWIAPKLNVKEYDLHDPDTNIRFGCWYLKFLKDRFSGDSQLMIAAYNAGHGKVEQWLAEGYGTDKPLSEIPYKETKNYLDKVNRAYAQYQKLYEIG